MVLGSATAIMAMGLARLGTPVAFVGRVGDDVWGRYCLEDMAGRGIDLSRVIRGGGLKTGVTVSITHPLDRALVTYLGAISALTGADVPDAAMAGLDHLHASSFFFQEGLRPDFPDLFARARRAGLTTSLDTGFDPSGQWDGGLPGDAARDRPLLPERGGARGAHRHRRPRGGPAPARERAHARRGQAGEERGHDARRRPRWSTCPPTRSRRSTPPAPATPSTPASSTGGCRARPSSSACGWAPPAARSARWASAGPAAQPTLAEAEAPRAGVVSAAGLSARARACPRAHERATTAGGSAGCSSSPPSSTTSTGRR